MPEELCELTGIRVGRRGKTHELLQVAWLRTSDIAFWTNERGRLIFARGAAARSRTTFATGAASLDVKSRLARTP